MKERADSGTRQVAISLPFIGLRLTLPFTKVTSIATLISVPANTTRGERPVTAMVNSVSSGAGVLHTKSLLPPLTTDDSTAATKGSVEVIFTAKADEEILGEKVSSVTTPAVTTRELRPTGMKTPSAESSSTVTLASTSPGVKSLNTCAGAVPCPVLFP